MPEIRACSTHLPERRPPPLVPPPCPTTSPPPAKPPRPTPLPPQLDWQLLRRASYMGAPYSAYKCSFPTPCAGRVWDALPPPSRTAHAVLILPDRPAEGAPAVVHLAATGDHGYQRRMHLGVPLVQQVRAWVGGKWVGGRLGGVVWSGVIVWRV